MRKTLGFTGELWGGRGIDERLVLILVSIVT